MLLHLPPGLWDHSSTGEMWIFLLKARGICFDVERCLLAFKDAMPRGPLWCDLTGDEKPKLRSRAARAEHLKPNSHKRKVQCVLPSRRAVLPCTLLYINEVHEILAAAQRRGTVCEQNAAADKAMNCLEMELIHAGKQKMLGFMTRVRHTWQRTWHPLSMCHFLLVS